MRISIILSITLASFALAADTPTVKPTAITETRIKELVKGSSWNRSGMEITIHVEGGGVDNATSYGKLKLATAVDDAGIDLKPKKEKGFFSSDDDSFKSIDKFRQDEKAKGFDIRLELGLPARAAKAIKEVKGDFQALAGGEEKIVEVKDLPSHAGKTLDDPALKAAKLQLKFSDKKTEGDAQSVPVEITGDANTIKEVEILDASGQKISSGYSSSSFGDKHEISYSISKPLDAGTTMKIHVLVGQKTFTVPFDLTNLALP